MSNQEAPHGPLTEEQELQALIASEQKAEQFLTANALEAEKLVAARDSARSSFESVRKNMRTSCGGQVVSFLLYRANWNMAEKHRAALQQLEANLRKNAQQREVAETDLFNIRARRKVVEKKAARGIVIEFPTKVKAS